MPYFKIISGSFLKKLSFNCKLTTDAQLDKSQSFIDENSEIFLLINGLDFVRELDEKIISNKNLKQLFENIVADN